MITEGRELPDVWHAEADVVVVGSGAGGATAAYTLAKAGKKVIVLEEGGYYTRKDFTQREAEMYPMLYAEEGARATRDLAIPVLGGRCVGGTTVVNYLVCFRTPDIVLNTWEKNFGLAGLNAALQPHFEIIEKSIHVQKTPVEELNVNNRLLMDGAAKLGYRGDTLSRNHKQCRQSGFCGEGCAYDAKQSMLVTHIPRAVALGAQVASDCRADKLIREGGRVVGVSGTILDRASRNPRGSFEVRARHVIVAGGPLGTPQLLGKSGIDHPELGRNLSLHPAVPVSAEFEQDVICYHGLKQGYAVDHFSKSMGATGRWDFIIEGVGSQPGLTAAGLPGFGNEMWGFFKNNNKVAVGVGLIHDVSRGSVTFKSDGRADIDYTMNEEDTAQARESMLRMAEIYFAAGAKRVLMPFQKIASAGSFAEVPGLLNAARYLPGDYLAFSAHPQGTCRMHADPAKGVVDQTGKVHGLDGLYVMDVSTVPTPTAVNPQISTMALASLNATRLANS